MSFVKDIGELLGAGADPQGLPPPNALNPSYSIILDLLGMSMRQHGSGDDKGQWHLWRDPSKQSILEGPVEGGGLAGALSEYIWNPLGLSSSEQSLYDDLFMGGGLNETFETSYGALGDILGFATEGAETGFPVDTEFITKEAQRRYRREDLPLIAEIAGANYGLGSSAFVGAASDAAMRGEMEAAGLIAQFDNEAANRRAQLQIPAANIAGAYGGFPSAFLGDVFGLGQAFRNFEDQQTLRPYEIFSQLTGFAGPQYQTFLAPSYNPTDEKSQMLAGLGSTLPSLGGL